MREHLRAITLGAFALGAGAAVAAVTVSIATGHTARSTPVFARTSSLASSRGAVGPGLSLDGTTVAKRHAGTKHELGKLGGGDEVIAALTGSLAPVAVPTPDGAYVVYSSWRQIGRIKPDARGQGLSTGDPVGVPSIRLFDLRSGKDSLLATGAASPAVSSTRRRRVPGGRQHNRASERRVHRPHRRRGLGAGEAACLDEPSRPLPAVRVGREHAPRLPRRARLGGRRSLRLHGAGRIAAAGAERVRHRRLARRHGGARLGRHANARADPRLGRRRPGQPRARRLWPQRASTR